MACITTVAFPILGHAHKLRGKEDCLPQSVGSRAVYAILIPVSAAMSILDISLGIIAAIGTLLTLGLYQPLFKFAADQLETGTKLLIVVPYLNLIRFIKPEAAWSNDSKLISSKWKDWGVKIAQEFQTEENVLPRYILSRAMYAATLVGLIFTHTIELGIAIIVAPLALICLGKITPLNSIAMQALTFPRIIHEVFFLTTKAINPWAGD